MCTPLTVLTLMEPKKQQTNDLTKWKSNQLDASLLKLDGQWHCYIPAASHYEDPLE